jgi:hypothetical protein
MNSTDSIFQEVITKPLTEVFEGPPGNEPSPVAGEV